MALLTDLPDELLEMIFESLHARILSALSITCRQFNILVEPHLYKNIAFHWESYTPHPPVARLLFTLLERPTLASYTRSLEFSGQADRGFTSTLKHGPGGQASVWGVNKTAPLQYRRDVRELIDSVGLPESAQWLRSYCEGVVVAVVALILAQTPNLETLKLSTEFQRQSSILPELFKCASTQRLAKLKWVVCGRDVNSIHSFDSLMINDEQITSLTYLPNLDTLEVVIPRLSLPWLTSPAPRTNLSMSNLVSLRLPYCGISGEALKHLLRAMPNLIDLDIDFVHESNQLDEAYLFGNEHFSTGLRRANKKLRSLRFSIEFYTFNRQVSWDAGEFEDLFGIEPKDLLYSFTELRILELPLFVLFGANPMWPVDLSELLPSGLRELLLVDDLADTNPYGLTDDGSMLASFAAYLELVPNQKLPLESFSLILKLTDKEWHEEKRILLQRCCEKANVRCTIDKRRRDV